MATKIQHIFWRIRSFLQVGYHFPPYPFDSSALLWIEINVDMETFRLAGRQIMVSQREWASIKKQLFSLTFMFNQEEMESPVDVSRYHIGQFL